MDASELQELFSKNLKKARNIAGLSQMRLAEKANLSVGYICDLESGRRWGTPETFSKLSQALQIHPYELLLPVLSKESYNLNVTFRREYASQIGNEFKNNINLAVSEAISETLQKISI